MKSSHIVACAAGLALAVASTGTAIAPAQAQSADSLELRPAGGWTADFADESCALRRNFSDGTTSVVFEMSQVAPGNAVEVAVASPTLAARHRAPRTQFLPGDSPSEALFYRPFTTDDGLQGFAVDDTMVPPEERPRPPKADGDFIWPQAARDQRERTITGYSVARVFDKDLILQTGSLHEPMKVMRACLDDLIQQWGLDPVAHHTLSRPATVNFDAGWVGGIIRQQASLVNDRGPISARARLLVDESGKVTGCRLLNMPSDTGAARDFCDMMQKRARLTPALDAGGQPIKSFYIWQVVINRRS